MKNIKSIIVTVCCLCTSMGIQAQAETKKMAGKPTPQVALPPVKSPEMPDAPKPVAKAELVAQTPSQQGRDKNLQPAEAEKPNFILVEFKEPETPGGEEGKKIMAGKTTKPAPVITNHSTIDPTAAPQIPKPTKPSNGKQQ